MLLAVLASGSYAAPPSAGGATDPLEVERPAVPDLAPVVGGDPAPEGKWPDAVALFAAGDLFACSGVLVAPDAVLTAGHCQFALETAVVGTNDLESGGERVRIAEVVGHDDYTSTYDVALVRLERPITTIAPRTLALDCVVDDWLRDGATVHVVGFGATDPQATTWTSALNEAATTVRDADCSDLGAGCYAAVSPGGELSAGGDGVDSCVGDSGGPLYLDTPEGAFLLGTTSRAAIPARTVCGDGGIYVRADAVAGWIEEQLGHALPRPACEGWNHVPHPIAEPIAAPSGGFGATRIDPADGDADDVHVFEVVEGPEHGAVELDADGTLVYAAPLGFHGEDAVLVRVTDDGEPPLSGEVEVPITVSGARGVAERPGGCATAPAGGSLVLALVALARRARAFSGRPRRRRAPASGLDRASSP